MDLTPRPDARPSGRQWLRAGDVPGRRYDLQRIYHRVSGPDACLARAGFDGIRIEDFRVVIDADPAVEVLLLGCGERMNMPQAALRQALRQAGISLEPMATGAACRTYNLLLEENRRVAAALLVL